MCIVSNVYDSFDPLIPYPRPSPVQPNNPGAGMWPWTPQLDLAPLEKLIADFKEAVETAKKLDRLMGNADCADPEKAKLEARVRELETQIENINLRARVKELEKALVKANLGSPTSSATKEEP